jgi:NAD-dependent SIR2 family protein deacetylase
MAFAPAPLPPAFAPNLLWDPASHAVDEALAALISAAPADPLFDRAAEAILQADQLLIGAGAGMGVDSGLPDFRGPEGFWRAYPALGRRQIRFEEAANPIWFEREPQLAWSFYGHRLLLYRNTVPHAGFGLLREIAKRIPTHIYTSNVDGQFQRAGFTEDQIFEVHGSIHHLQRIDGEGAIWSAEDLRLVVDLDQLRLHTPLPHCPTSGVLARPNVLMFGDYHWIETRARAQSDRFETFVASLPAGANRTTIELGAGTAIPTVRWTCAQLASRGQHIRINTRDPQGGANTLSLARGARDALAGIAKALAARGFFDQTKA